MNKYNYLIKLKKHAHEQYYTFKFIDKSSTSKRVAVFAN